MTSTTAEIIPPVDGEQTLKGMDLPFGDLIIGACTLELGFAIGTSNLRGVRRIPGLL